MVGLAEVLHLTGYRSKVSIWSLEKRGLFPARLRIGPNKVGWLRVELEARLASRPRGIGAEAVPVK